MDAQETRELHQALLGAFDRAALERMLKVKLEIRLDRLVGTKLPLTSAVDQLIEVANHVGWAADLVAAAFAEQPTNDELARLHWRAYQGAAPARPEEADAVREGPDGRRLPGMVCRVEVGGHPEGTGVLVAPSLVLTAYEAIDRVIAGRVRPDRVRLSFGTEDVGLAQDWLFDESPPVAGGLGYALVRLEQPAGAEPVGSSKGWVKLGDPATAGVGTPLDFWHYPGVSPQQAARGGEGVTAVAGDWTRAQYSVRAGYLSPGAPGFAPDGRLAVLHLRPLAESDQAEAVSFEGVPATALCARLANLGKLAALDAVPAPVAAEEDPPRPGPGPDPEDPQKGRWGRKAERAGRKLRVEVIGEARDNFFFNAIVASTDETPLQGPVLFHLHHSYPQSIYRIRKIRENKEAMLEEVSSTGVYTLGAQVKDAKGRWVGLESNLARVKGVPKRFHGR